MMNRGYYGNFGGAFLPEILVATFDELEAVYNTARRDPAFWQEYEQLMASYSCRPTPITFAENLTRHFGGARIFIKREDLNHTGAHKANNVMGAGAFGQTHGQDAGDRRNRCRPAWGGHGHHGRPFRIRLHHLHG